jgi:hypothetical protein
VKKRVTFHWEVVAVDGRGYGHGSCGHRHASSGEATMCNWAPPGWDEMLVCDLLVREVRDEGIDPKRRRGAKRVAAARQLTLEGIAT